MPRGAGSRTPRGGGRNSAGSKEEVIAVAHAETIAKIAVARTANDVQLTPISLKCENALRNANDTVVTAMMNQIGRGNLATLIKLEETLKDSSSPAQKVRAVVKVVFKDDISLIASKEMAVKALNEFQVGAMDSSVKHSLLSQYCSEDGVMSWAKFEKELNDMVKNGIFHEGKDAGRDEAERDMAI